MDLKLNYFLKFPHFKEISLKFSQFFSRQPTCKSEQIFLQVFPVECIFLPLLLMRVFIWVMYPTALVISFNYLLLLIYSLHWRLNKFNSIQFDSLSPFGQTTAVTEQSARCHLSQKPWSKPLKLPKDWKKKPTRCRHTLVAQKPLKL